MASTRSTRKRLLQEPVEGKQKRTSSDSVVSSLDKDGPLYYLTDTVGFRHIQAKNSNHENVTLTICEVSKKKSSVCSFESIFPGLKSRLKSEQGGLIIENCFCDVINNLLQNPNQIEYSKRVKRLASTVYFYSRDAYNYLRSFAKLPHPSTLFYWASISGGKPGFTQESFVQISKQAKIHGNGGQIYCCLVLDEMQIKQQVDFDGEEIVGHCDLGHGNLSDDHVPVAKEALMFVAIALNRVWRVPIGYCLVDGLEGSVRANLVRVYLQKLHDAEVQCVAVTCSGIGHNLNMFKELGVDLNSTSRKHWFEHPCDPNRKVYTFFDVAHMIKALRNLLGERGVLIDSSKEKDSNQIEWKYFSNLHALQQRLMDEQLNDVNRKEHDGQAVDDEFNEKDGLSKNILNTSPSFALHFCEKMGMEGFQGSSTTAEFASKIDDIFDLLNSKSIFESGCNNVVRRKNKLVILQRISELIKYLEGLKEPVSADLSPVINGSRKVGALGLIFDLMSVKSLAEELVWRNSSTLMGLLTERLSQGNLEMLFDNIRKHAGGVYNPTAIEFRTAYRNCVVESVCVTNKKTI